MAVFKKTKEKENLINAASQRQKELLLQTFGYYF